MATMGSVPLNSEMPYQELNMSSTTTGTIGNGAYFDYPILNWTMPYAGSAAVLIEWSWTWSGYQQIVTDVSLSTPAPTVKSPAESSLAYTPGYVFVVIYENLLWTGLSSGQQISAVMRVTAGTGGSGITCDWRNINFRVWRA